jgi:hypothetical protein
VPLADLFNHQESNHVAFEVCCRVFSSLTRLATEV